jgi:GTP diphosphokinase / guanosine-3',5'-bis(diphosphate) 3'-diphosphatase
MSTDVLALTRGLLFAARKHSDQRRKGVAAEPYVNHVAEVALLVAEATEGRDVVAVLAALLHDTIEDTPTSREELEREFGAEVAAVVVEVTDDRSLSKQERKRLQVERAPLKSDRAKLVKIADKTSNLRSIVKSPPLGWDAARRREYLEWAKLVVAGCRGVNPRLEAWFDEAYAAGIATFDPRRAMETP